MDKVKNKTQVIDQVTVRFAGDSGDGMQLTGMRFTRTTALVKNDLSTFPDYPAEIRAPVGTLFGVSSFQIHFGSRSIHTPGDSVDVLVAMNPAALKKNIGTLKKHAIIIVNTDNFVERNLKLAGYESNPLEDNSLEGFQLYKVPITTLTREALKESSLTSKEKDRCKNFLALGIVYWLYTRPLNYTLAWIEKKFAKKPELAEANSLVLKAGRNFAQSTELFASNYEVKEAPIKPGIYRNITGNNALAYGIVAGAIKSGLDVVYGSYPITPASDILHALALYKNYGVMTFQAEDEIAAIGAALGASFAGKIGITATSGPGLALKTEFINLAVMTELPLIICDVQRAGPSTGMPTKTEQTDLLATVHGRPGEAPLPVIAPHSPGDCFNAAYEAFQVAIKFMTPVIVLSDLYLANGTEPWLLPDTDKLPPIEVEFAKYTPDFHPYARDEKTLARPWAIPGTPGLEHRIGGLEKDIITGDVSYEAENHDKMTQIRAEKIEKIESFITDPDIDGPDEGEVLVVSWGSSYGCVLAAVEELRNEGKEVSFYHLRWMNPMPRNLDYYIRNFRKILVPELNLGHLRQLLRAKYLVDVVGMNRVTGQPMRVSEVKAAINQLLEG